MLNEVMSAYRRHIDGMWWTNDAANKEKFTLKYGRKFLNFYNAADKYMNLPKKAFYAQRKDMIYNIIVTYVKNDKIDDIQKMIESVKDKEIYSECMKDIINRNIWFLDYLKQQDKENKELEETKNELKRIKNSKAWKLLNLIKFNKNNL